MRSLVAAALACAGVPLITLASIVPAHAHVVAGNRVFPVTLTFDDPGVGDEVSLPALTYTRSAADGGTGPAHEVDLGFEFDKTITTNTAIILNDGYDIQQRTGSKTETGWENLVITGKWQAYTNAEHEFVASLGLQREVGGTGTTHTGADRYGSTSPTLYAGKGLGDLPIGMLRALAVTGELFYTIADKGLKEATVTDPDTGLVSLQFNNGNNNAWTGGFSIQYLDPLPAVAGEECRDHRHLREPDPDRRVRLDLAGVVPEHAGHDLDRGAGGDLPGRLGRARARGADPAEQGRRHQCRRGRPGALLLRRSVPQHDRQADHRMRMPPMKTIMLAAALAAMPLAAQAHAFLKTATPAVGSTIATPPTAVTINFTEGVEPHFSSITVQDAQGKRVDKNDPHLAGGQAQLAVDLAPLPPGTYKVTWHATATDTHKTQGSFSFTVRP